MKRIVRKQVLWQCSVCKTSYPNKRDAARCEKRMLEGRRFKIGDRVKNIFPRTCQTRPGDYTFSGQVIKIVGPLPNEIEYGCSHVFEYLVEYVCPRCKTKKQALYHSFCLKLIR